MSPGSIVEIEKKDRDNDTPELGHAGEPKGAPAFKFSSLWRPAEVNPLNLKSYTLPIFNLRDPYARNFHLFVAMPFTARFPRQYLYPLLSPVRGSVSMLPCA